MSKSWAQIVKDGKSSQPKAVSVGSASASDKQTSRTTSRPRQTNAEPRRGVSQPNPRPTVEDTQMRLMDLPSEMGGLIFSHLDPPSASTFAVSCRALHLKYRSKIVKGVDFILAIARAGYVRLFEWVLRTFGKNGSRILIRYNWIETAIIHGHLDIIRYVLALNGNELNQIARTNGMNFLEFTRDTSARYYQSEILEYLRSSFNVPVDAHLLRFPERRGKMLRWYSSHLKDWRVKFPLRSLLSAAIDYQDIDCLEFLKSEYPWDVAKTNQLCPDLYFRSVKLDALNWLSKNGYTFYPSTLQESLDRGYTSNDLELVEALEERHGMSPTDHVTLKYCLQEHNILSDDLYDIRLLDRLVKFHGEVVDKPFLSFAISLSDTNILKWALGHIAIDKTDGDLYMDAIPSFYITGVTWVNVTDTIETLTAELGGAIDDSIGRNIKVLLDAKVPIPDKFISEVFRGFIIDDPEWRAYDPDYVRQRFELLPVRSKTLSLVERLSLFGFKFDAECFKIAVMTHCVSFAKILAERYSTPFDEKVVDDYLEEYKRDNHKNITSMVKYLASLGLKPINIANQRSFQNHLKKS